MALGFLDGVDGFFEVLAEATEPDDLDLLRGYLDDSGVPAWVLRRIITDRLPAAEGAIACATARSRFDWSRGGEQLLASTPGDQEPTVTVAIMPSICRA